MPKTAASKSAIRKVTTVVKSVIEDYVNKHSVTQKVLAQKLQVTEATVSRWMNYERPATVRQLVELFNLTSDDRLIALLRLSVEDATYVEREHNNVRWIEFIPPHFTVEQREEMEAGFNIFDAFFVEGLSTDNVRRSRSRVGFEDITHFYEVYKSSVRADALRLTFVPRALELEEQLLQAFRKEGLRAAIVADVNEKCDGSLIRAEFVAWLFANEVLPRMSRQKAIGLGYGYTLLRCSEIATPSSEVLAGVDFVPMCAINYRFSKRNYANTEAAKIPSSNYIARRFEGKFPSTTGWYRRFYRDEDEMREENNSDHQEFEDQVKQLSSIITSVNGFGRRSFAELEDEAPVATQWRTSDYLPLANMSEVFNKLTKTISTQRDYGEFTYSDIAGEVMGVFFDEKGQALRPARQPKDSSLTYDQKQVHIKKEEMRGKIDLGIDSAFLQLDLEKLRQTNSRGNVWIVASRNYKARPTYYAIKNQLANSIIIDREIAKILLEMKAKDS